MKEYVLRNARVVTPTTVMHGHVLVRDGLVADVDEGDIQPTAALECIDCEGDYLLPGFVELHTDNLEKHLVPRPKVVWPQAEPAFFAHDAQIVAAGITTVFDALSVGEYHDKGRIAMLAQRLYKMAIFLFIIFSVLRCAVSAPRFGHMQLGHI